MSKLACIIFVVFILAAGIVAQETTAAPAPAPTALADHAETAVPQPTPVLPPPLELKPDASGNVPEEQMRELLRRAADKDVENNKRLRDYTYIQRQEQHHLDGKGNVKKVESQTSEVLMIYGEQVLRQIEKDDKPLPEKEAKKEEEKIQEIIDKRKNESDSDRRKRLEKEEKLKEEDREFVREVPDAFSFHLVGSEDVGGREAWILDAEPRPDYEPKHREAKIMMKFKGRLWIDKAELQLVKFDLEAIDDLSFGWVIARVHKGARAQFEQTRVNDEVWLPKRIQFRLDARLALLKSFHEDVERTFRDYKKFRSESKITVVGETQ